TANVHGSEVYFVEVNLTNLSKGSIRAYCDCPAFHTYDTSKHVVAVLLSIANKTIEDQKFVGTKLTERFMDTMTATYHKELEGIHEKTPLHVEYYCKWSEERNLYIELKAGENRCFVVRDAYQFLKNVLEGNEHYFTK